MKPFLYAFGAMVWLWCLWLTDSEFNCIAKPFFCFPVRNLQFLAFRFIIAFYNVMVLCPLGLITYLKTFNFSCFSPSI